MNKYFAMMLLVSAALIVYLIIVTLIIEYAEYFEERNKYIKKHHGKKIEYDSDGNIIRVTGGNYE